MDYAHYLQRGGVPSSSVETCMRWALGDGFGSMPIEDSDEVWNQKHGDLFMLLGSDRRDESLVRIGRAYMENVYGTDKS